MPAERRQDPAPTRRVVHRPAQGQGQAAPAVLVVDDDVADPLVDPLVDSLVDALLDSLDDPLELEVDALLLESERLSVR
jgi:hypothetical protein